MISWKIMRCIHLVLCLINVDLLLQQDKYYLLNDQYIKNQKQLKLLSKEQRDELQKNNRHTKRIVLEYDDIYRDSGVVLSYQKSRHFIPDHLKEFSIQFVNKYCQNIGLAIQQTHEWN